jgi:hypothetical protein
VKLSRSASIGPTTASGSYSNPRILFEGKTKKNAGAAADFGRERTVKPYNRQLNDRFGFWRGCWRAMASRSLPLASAMPWK